MTKWAFATHWMTHEKNMSLILSLKNSTTHGHPFSSRDTIKRRSWHVVARREHSKQRCSNTPKHPQSDVLMGGVQEEADFGQSRFGHPDLTNFGQSNFGQSQFWPIQFWPIQFFGQCGGAPKVGAPKGGAPQGWGPEGWGAKPRKVRLWGPEGWGLEQWGPKISRFFFSLSRHIFFFFPSLLVCFVEFWCLKRRDAQMCAFGVLWLSCEVPAARSGGAAGVPHDNQRAPTCTYERPSLHTTKIQREDPQREKKERNFRREREKKRAKFWAVQGKGLPAEGGSGGEDQNTPTTHTHTHNNNTENTQTQHTQQTSKNQQHRTFSHTKTNHNNTPKKMIGPKWIGQNWLAKHDGQKWIGQNWIGQSRP